MRVHSILVDMYLVAWKHVFPFSKPMIQSPVLKIIGRRGWRPQIHYGRRGTRQRNSKDRTNQLAPCLSHE